MAAMTVERLIAELTNLPYDAIVVLAKDAEGNSFSPLPDDDGVTVGRYAAERTWSGQFYGETEEDGWTVPDGAVRAVCLWPTN